MGPLQEDDGRAAPRELTGSDKYYWHRYTEAYREAFARTERSIPIRRIVEWGVFRGESIAWLRGLFPAAEIHGIDIVSPLPSWPRDPGIHYDRVDQGDFGAVESFYRSVPAPDLIIEDGSHETIHQANCLRAGFRALRPGGLYILEDIHTALCEVVNRTRLLRHRAMRRVGISSGADLKVNVLSLLLGLDHLAEIGDDTPAALDRLARDSHFQRSDVEYLCASIAGSTLYRRNRLPRKCWKCGTSDFDYRVLRCSCGADIFGPADSMSYIITKKTSAGG